MNDIINNTEEAIAFGQSMNQEMMEEMKRGQKLYAKLTDLAIDRDDLEEASKLATKGQLCREAVEAFDGTLKLHNQS